MAWLRRQSRMSKTSPRRSRKMVATHLELNRGAGKKAALFLACPHGTEDAPRAFSHWGQVIKPDLTNGPQNS